MPRSSVDYVVMGLVYAGCDPRTAEGGARELAANWLANVFFLCEQAGLELNETEVEEVEAWIVGSLPSDVPA